MTYDPSKLDIDQILNHHASDKHSQNGYGPIYHALFAPLRQRPIRLLEVGIGTVTPGAHVSMYGHDLPGYRPGASLRAWRDYFANGDIVGMDVQPDTMIRGEDRIYTILADSTNGMQMMGWPLGQFDVIIDDGSHLVEHQLATLGNLYRRVFPGGLYIIEDVNRLDPNQPRLPHDHVEALKQIIGDDLYFVVASPKADVVVITKRRDPTTRAIPPSTPSIATFTEKLKALHAETHGDLWGAAAQALWDLPALATSNAAADDIRAYRDRRNLVKTMFAYIYRHRAADLVREDLMLLREMMQHLDDDEKLVALRRRYLADA